MDTISSNMVSGMVRPGRVYDEPGAVTVFPSMGGDIEVPGRWEAEGCWEENLTLFDWAGIVGQLLRGSPDGKLYSISTVYIEYENNGGAPVTPPTFNRSGARAYYDALSGDANRDYLRVPLTASTFDSTNPTNFPDGNRVNFLSQSVGIAGVHGKTFSDGVSSRVYGGALVATPVGDDQTQDIVHSRFYFTVAANQLIKQAGSQITMTWPLTLQ